MALRFMTAEEAACFVKHDDNVGFSGFTPAGSPKEVPTAIAKMAEEEHAAGRPFKIGVYTGASTGDSLDGALARAKAIKFRTPFQSNEDLKKGINSGEIEYFDLHLSQLAQEIRHGSLPKLTVAVIEASDVTESGIIVLTSAVGNSPTFVNQADIIIVELNAYHPKALFGLHDIIVPLDPPYRRAIPINDVRDRIGVPILKVDPNKIVAVVESNRKDQVKPFSPVDALTTKIGDNVAEFLAGQLKMGKIPKHFLPIQSGVGNIANAVLSSLGGNKEIPPFTMYTEVIQDSVISLMKEGNILFASGCSLTVSADVSAEVYSDLNFFLPKLVLRPAEISNSPEIAARLGLITINTAIEADIFGNINSTHVMGTKMMNGIGGSGDFTRNAYCSIFTCPSVAKGGGISAIVPMVSHTDNNEHSVKVLITEQGIADLRGKSPMQKAQVIIENCAHPDYKQLLWDYIHLSSKQRVPHALHACFGMHVEFMKSGDMRKTDWSKYV
jgi:succinate CoA transferase